MKAFHFDMESHDVVVSDKLHENLQVINYKYYQILSANFYTIYTYSKNCFKFLNNSFFEKTPVPGTKQKLKTSKTNGGNKKVFILLIYVFV